MTSTKCDKRCTEIQVCHCNRKEENWQWEKVSIKWNYCIESQPSDVKNEISRISSEKPSINSQSLEWKKWKLDANSAEEWKLNTKFMRPKVQGAKPRWYFLHLAHGVFRSSKNLLNFLFRLFFSLDSSSSSHPWTQNTQLFAFFNIFPARKINVCSVNYIWTERTVSVATHFPFKIRNSRIKDSSTSSEHQQPAW